jgi:hypothetical protein
MRNANNQGGGKLYYIVDGKSWGLAPVSISNNVSFALSLYYEHSSIEIINDKELSLQQIIDVLGST